MADHHIHHHQQGGVMREYRKGNWTVSETMVLIEAKKMDDERRMKRNVTSTLSSSSNAETSSSSSKPTELRWKWVEDYCWRKGCLRSQNQCNDKWDNLMRDYKKVRDYERKLLTSDNTTPNLNNAQAQASSSYWKLEKNQRKDNSLPSNMLPQIYQALVELAELANRGGGQKVGSASAAAAPAGNSNVNMIGYFVQPPLFQHHQALSASTVPPLLTPNPPQPPSPPHPQTMAGQPAAIPLQTLPTMCERSDSDRSEYSGSPAKRRRSSTGKANYNDEDEEDEVGNAISKSASIIAEALKSCDEREERRHKDMLNVHERRLRIEETKTEINRQGIHGLVDAINKLADSIFAFAASSSSSHNNNNTNNPSSTLFLIN